MTRASRARRIASAAAYGGGGLVGVGATVLGVLLAEAQLARRAIGHPTADPLDPSGTYLPPLPTVDPAPLRLVMVGDSSAAGFGVETPDETPAAVLARGLAEALGRPVVASTVAQVGAQSRDLHAQLDRVLGGPEAPAVPDVAVVMIGANDVTHRVLPAESVRHLGEAVTRLREAGVEVVVGTCPDLGTVRPIRHPLRLVARRWSRSLAAAQTIAVVEAGGRSVSLGDLLGAEFEQRANELFGPDRFHPSAAGYAAAAGALLPSVCAALEQPGVEAPGAGAAGVDVLPVSEAAAEAVEAAGTEVTGAQLDGRPRGPRGLWAVLQRLPRHVPSLPPVASRTTDDRPEPAPAVEDVGPGRA